MSHWQPRARASSAVLPQIKVPGFWRPDDGSTVEVPPKSEGGWMCLTMLYKMMPNVTRMRNVEIRIPRQKPKPMIFKRRVRRRSLRALGIRESCCVASSSSSCRSWTGSYFGGDEPMVFATRKKRLMSNETQNNSFYQWKI